MTIPLKAEVQFHASTRHINSLLNNFKKEAGKLNLTVDTRKAAKSIGNVTKTTTVLNKHLSQSAHLADEFAVSIGNSARKFAAYAAGTAVIIKMTGALQGAVSEAINFDREMVRVGQVLKKNKGEITELKKEITQLSTEVGISVSKIAQMTVTLAQAGIRGNDLSKSMRAVAKADLAPTFKDMASTADGVVAIFRQFKISGDDVEKTLGKINAVSKAFAVESEDILTAVKKVGGVFASSGGQVEELIALFTSVRATSRESADTIATGLRTIFTRIKRPETIAFLKEMNIEIADMEGNIQDPIKAVKQIADQIKTLGITAQNVKYSQLVEQLGGLRQVSKLIPLINETALSQEALNVARKGGNSLDADQARGIQSIAKQFEKLKAEFQKVVIEISDTESFRLLTTGIIETSKSIVKLISSLKELVPYLGLLAVFTGSKSVLQGLGTRTSKLKTIDPGVGVPGMKDGGLPGKVPKGTPIGRDVFQAKGIDKIPAMLAEGEFVVNNKSVAQGRNLEVLQNMNQGAVYAASGGLIGGAIGAAALGGGQFENMLGVESNTVASEAIKFGVIAGIMSKLATTIKENTDATKTDTKAKKTVPSNATQPGFNKASHLRSIEKNKHANFKRIQARNLQAASAVRADRDLLPKQEEAANNEFLQNEYNKQQNQERRKEHNNSKRMNKALVKFKKEEKTLIREAETEIKANEKQGTNNQDAQRQLARHRVINNPKTNSPEHLPINYTAQNELKSTQRRIAKNRQIQSQSYIDGKNARTERNNVRYRAEQIEKADRVRSIRQAPRASIGKRIKKNFREFGDSNKGHAVAAGFAAVTIAHQSYLQTVINGHREATAEAEKAGNPAKAFTESLKASEAEATKTASQVIGGIAGGVGFAVAGPLGAAIGSTLGSFIGVIPGVSDAVTFIKDALTNSDSSAAQRQAAREARSRANSIQASKNFSDALNKSKEIAESGRDLTGDAGKDIANQVAAGNNAAIDALLAKVTTDKEENKASSKNPNTNQDLTTAVALAKDELDRLIEPFLRSGKGFEELSETAAGSRAIGRWRKLHGILGTSAIIQNNLIKGYKQQQDSISDELKIRQGLMKGLRESQAIQEEYNQTILDLQRDARSRRSQAAAVGVVAEFAGSGVRVGQKGFGTNLIGQDTESQEFKNITLQLSQVSKPLTREFNKLQTGLSKVKDFKESFTNLSGIPTSGEQQGEVSKIVSKFQSGLNIDPIDQEKVFSAIGKPDEIKALIKDLTEKVTKDPIANIEKARKIMSDDISVQSKMLQEITAIQDKRISIENRFNDRITQVHNAFDTNALSLRDVQTNRRNRARSFGIGGIGTNDITSAKKLASNIDLNIKALAKFRRGIEEGTVPLKDAAKIENDLVTSINRSKQAFDALTETSNDLKAIQAEHAKSEAVRTSILSKAQNLTFGGIADRRKFAQNRELARFATGGGNVQNLPEELRAQLFGFLQEFESVAVFGGLTGRDVIDQETAKALSSMGLSSEKINGLLNASKPIETKQLEELIKINATLSKNLLISVPSNDTTFGDHKIKTAKIKGGKDGQLRVGRFNEDETVLGTGGAALNKIKSGIERDVFPIVDKAFTDSAPVVAAKFFMNSILDAGKGIGSDIERDISTLGPLVDKITPKFLRDKPKLTRDNLADKRIVENRNAEARKHMKAFLGTDAEHDSVEYIKLRRAADEEMSTRRANSRARIYAIRTNDPRLSSFYDFGLTGSHEQATIKQAKRMSTITAANTFKQSSSSPGPSNLFKTEEEAKKRVQEKRLIENHFKSVGVSIGSFVGSNFSSFFSGKSKKDNNKFDVGKFLEEDKILKKAAARKANQERFDAEFGPGGKSEQRAAFRAANPVGQAIKKSINLMVDFRPKNDPIKEKATFEELQARNKKRADAFRKQKAEERRIDKLRDSELGALSDDEFESSNKRITLREKFREGSIKQLKEKRSLGLDNAEGRRQQRNRAIARKNKQQGSLNINSNYLGAATDNRKFIKGQTVDFSQFLKPGRMEQIFNDGMNVSDAEFIRNVVSLSNASGGKNSEIFKAIDSKRGSNGKFSAEKIRPMFKDLADKTLENYTVVAKRAFNIGGFNNIPLFTSAKVSGQRFISGTINPNFSSDGSLSNSLDALLGSKGGFSGSVLRQVFGKDFFPSIENMKKDLPKFHMGANSPTGGLAKIKNNESIVNLNPGDSVRRPADKVGAGQTFSSSILTKTPEWMKSFSESVANLVGTSIKIELAPAQVAVNVSGLDILNSMSGEVKTLVQNEIVKAVSNVYHVGDTGTHKVRS